MIGAALAVTLFLAQADTPQAGAPDVAFGRAASLLCSCLPDGGRADCWRALDAVAQDPTKEDLVAAIAAEASRVCALPLPGDRMRAGHALLRNIAGAEAANDQRSLPDGYVFDLP